MSGSYSEGTLKLRANRKQYLIIYSKADLVKFATRESFCDALISCFNATSKVASEITTCIQLYSQKLYVIFLVNGRGKHRNIFIVGPADCAKTSVLAPLQKISNTFSKPAGSWQQIFLVGRWECRSNIPRRFSLEPWFNRTWKELLLLVKGQTVHIPTPKNIYARDIYLDRDTPIFATGKAEIKYIGKFNTTDEIENEMMSVRWRLLKFQPADIEIWAKESALLFEMIFEIGSDGRTVNSLVLFQEFFNLSTRNNT